MKNKTYKGTILPILEWKNVPTLKAEMTKYLVSNCNVTLSGLTKPTFTNDIVCYNDLAIHIGTLSELIEETDEVLSETPEEVLDATLIDDTQEHFIEPSGAPEAVLEGSKVPFVMSKSKLEKIMAKRRTHYVKLTLSNHNLSFRYFYESQDNPHRVDNWWMVSHQDKQYIKVTYEFVQRNLQDVTAIHEIIGRQHKKQGYLKIIKDLQTGDVFEGKNL